MASKKLSPQGARTVQSVSVVITATTAILAHEPWAPRWFIALTVAVVILHTWLVQATTALSLR